MRETIITAKKKWFDINLPELWQYRDLLFLLFKRDVKSVYKQTLLGPLWFFIQPILTSLALTVVQFFFNASTDGHPAFLFNLCGFIPWSFFTACLISNSNLFYQNQNVFGKVYFPRLLVPFSLVLSNLLKFSMQFVLLIGVWAIYFLQNKADFTWHIVLFPFHLFFMSLLGMGIGMICSALTIKFRDITFIIGFAVQLAMWCTPIIYPLSKTGKYTQLVLFNPMSSIIESFKFGLLGNGYHNINYIFYSYIISIVFFIIGIATFTRTEKTFIDKI